MKVQDLQLALNSAGYQVKKITGKNIDIIVESDRVTALTNIAKQFKGKYNPKGGSSSIGRAELPDGLYVNAKPKGGGSGAGSDITTLAESAQCVYCAAVWNNKDYSGTSFKAVKSSFAIDGKLEDIINKLPEQWIASCMLSAEKLKKEFGRKKYTFHRGSAWVDALENHWKTLNKKESLFANLNKWSPADIYMVSDTGSRINLQSTNTIVELNSMMMEAIKVRDIIGVSLKQVKGSASLAYKNIDSTRYTYKFESLTTGKRGFLLSGDSYINFSGGEIQFRTFGSTWQGEIKGKNANMGKISGGPINAIMARNNIKIKPQTQIVNKTPELLKEFYKFYKHFEKTNALPEEQFIAAITLKDQNWWVSKFLSAQLMYYIDMHKDKDAVVTAMIGYAASESELSGPYAKVS